MIITGFGIKNFRSFDNIGSVLDNLNKLNIIIGKNNCGKSNILRFLQLINQHIDNLSQFPNDIKNQHRRNGKNPIIIVKIKGNELQIEINRLHKHHPFCVNDFINKSHLFDYDIIDGKIILPDFITSLNDIQLQPLQKEFSSASREEYLRVIRYTWSSLILNKIKNEFKDLIYIPHLRVIQEGHSFGDSNSSINGSNIISKMFEMQNPIIGDESSKIKFNSITSFVKDLLNKQDLQIEIPHTQEGIILTIDGNRLPLESFGTGIHQLVLLCSTLVIHENSIVCIEEPEIHLHPELQRKFIHFLGKTKNTYYISTHSNIFLDSSFKTSIYHLLNDSTKSTIIRAERNEQTFSILDDLGYHSSDILQANGVIWVEGPSDRTYILKWLNVLNPKLIEGLHFIVMFYGGRLLSQLSFQQENIISELIPLLRLNRNAFVIMDRDGFSSKIKINETKQRIKKEIGDKNTWVTKGREIENYLSSSTLTKWLKIEKIELNPDEKLEVTLSRIKSIKYNLNKSRYAKEISNYIGIADIESLDLKLKLSSLIKSIERWNIGLNH